MRNKLNEDIWKRWAVYIFLLSIVYFMFLITVETKDLQTYPWINLVILSVIVSAIIAAVFGWILKLFIHIRIKGKHKSNELAMFFIIMLLILLIIAFSYVWVISSVV